jgi:DNA-binding NtrC family response regulator
MVRGLRRRETNMARENDAKTYSILLVDDEEIILLTLGHSLRKAGYKVATAPNVQEAVEKLKGESFDLLISDLMMTELTGVDLLREVQRLGLVLKALIITGYGHSSLLDAALGLGARDYLFKPCTRDELLRKVETCLTQS